MRAKVPACLTFIPLLNLSCFWLMLMSFSQGQAKTIVDVKNRVQDLAVSKRSLVDFSKMVLCGTDRNTVRDGADYLNYGCWCGFGGSGQPVDDLDWCCYEHDMCYNDLARSELCGWPYNTMIYSRSYDTEECTKCAPASSYSWWEGYGKCRERLCKCDADAVKCFARSPFNQQYKRYDKKNLCTQPNPPDYRTGNSR